MPHRVFRWPWPVVVTKPNRRGYGMLLSDLLGSVHAARSLGARVIWLRGTSFNQAIHELESPEVRVLKGRAWQMAATVAWKTADAAEDVTARFDAFGTALRRGRPSELGAATRAELCRIRERRNRGRRGAVPPPIDLDYRRSWACAPIPIRLSRSATSAAERAAARLGLTSETPIVTLHVREPGFKERVGGNRASATARNADITTYFEAMDELVSTGYTIVRIGDATMTPVNRPGVIDLANSPHRSDLLELWALLVSRFFIACDSGPYTFAWFAQIPCIAVNVANMAQNYPLLPMHLSTFKMLRDRKENRLLSLEEMLDTDLLRAWKQIGERYELVDNSSDEIRDAVRDMLVHLGEPHPPTAEQEAFRSLFAKRAADPELARLLTKNGKIFPIRIRDGRHQYYPGKGRIAASFARAHFRRPGAEENASGSPSDYTARPWRAPDVSSTQR